MKVVSDQVGRGTHAKDLAAECVRVLGLLSTGDLPLEKNCSDVYLRHFSGARNGILVPGPGVSAGGPLISWFDWAKKIQSDLAAKLSLGETVSAGKDPVFHAATKSLKDAVMKVEILPVDSSAFPVKAKRPKNSRLWVGKFKIFEINLIKTTICGYCIKQ